jgi:hypothetical protein
MDPISPGAPIKDNLLAVCKNLRDARGYLYTVDGDK